jgi:DNA-directed RNA polymerase specialized sigma24 family protein
METSAATSTNKMNFNNCLDYRRNECLMELYKKFFKKVKYYVITNSGLAEDAEDVFQDALVLLLNKIDEGRLQLSCSLETYLYAVCRNLWYHRLTNLQHVRHFVGDEPAENAKEAIIYDSSDFKDQLINLVRHHYSMLDENSQKTLSLFANGTPHNETTEMMGYRNKDYAKARKYVCKEKLKSLIMQDPAYKKLQLEMFDS